MKWLHYFNVPSYNLDHHMKKALLYILLALGIWSCNDADESVFSESTDVRLTKLLTTYQDQLTGATDGWNGVMQTQSGGSYGFYMKFDAQNRVNMFSDFTQASASNAKESSYRLKAMQTPTLIFDTYSYLHVLADPNGSVNGGNDGEGLLSDFEFSIFPDSISADRMVFVGRKSNSKLVLTRASSAQATAYQNGDMGRSLAFANISKFKSYFKRFVIGNVAYEIFADQMGRSMIINWLEGSTVRTHETTFYYTASGVELEKPLVNGGSTISGFRNVAWDAVKGEINFTVDGTRGTITSASAPLGVDRGAFTRFRNAAVDLGSYWYSTSAITVEGEADAYGLTQTPNFMMMLFFPEYGVSGNSTYEAFAVFDGDNLMGPAIVPSYNASTGKVTFRILGTFGQNAEINATLGAFIAESNGFYFYQISEKSFDMVSAKDGRSWINWKL
jgi:hypothetical protein